MPGRPNHQDVLAHVDEVQRAKGEDLALGQPGVVGPVEGFEVFPRGRPDFIEVLIQLPVMHLSPYLTWCRVVVVEPNPHLPVIQIVPRHVGRLARIPFYRLNFSEGDTLLNEAMSEQLEPETDAFGLHISRTWLDKMSAEQVSDQVDEEPVHPTDLAGRFPDAKRNHGQPDGRSNQRNAIAQINYA